MVNSAHTLLRPFLFLTLSCQWVAWGCTRSWEATKPGHMISTNQRHIPFHTIWCHVPQKNVVGKFTRATTAQGVVGYWFGFFSLDLVFWGGFVCLFGRVFLGGQSLKGGACLCVSVFYLLNYLSQPMSFLSFMLLIFSPTSLRGSEGAVVWCLAA